MRASCCRDGKQKNYWSLPCDNCPSIPKEEETPAMFFMCWIENKAELQPVRTRFATLQAAHDQARHMARFYHKPVFVMGSVANIKEVPVELPTLTTYFALGKKLDGEKQS